MHIGVLTAGIVGIVTMAMAWFQWHAEQRIDHVDLDRRARLLAYQLKDSVQETLQKPEPEAAKALADQLEGRSRLIGYSVYRADGRRVASGRDLARISMK